MNFTVSYGRDISYCFRPVSGNEGIRSDVVESPLFRGFLTLDTNNDTFEVPSAFTTPDVSGFAKMGDNTPIKVFPLYVGYEFNSYSTGDAIIKKLMTTSFQARVAKIKTGKGEVYYGGKGMLFDKNFDPLILCTYKAHFDDTSGVADRKVMFDEKIIHVSPDVFIDQKSTVNKAILSKFIPFFLSIELSSRYSWVYPRITDASFGSKPRIVVDYMHGIFSKTAPPIPSDESESTRINKFLLENEHLISVE